MRVPPSLQIQTVLYNTSPESLRGYLGTLARSSEVARNVGTLGQVLLVIGDCSPVPALSSDLLDTLTHHWHQTGLDELRYEFFDANLGSAAGNNRILRTWQTDLVLMLNPDTIASPNMLVELISRLDDARIGVVEARQLPIEHSKDYDTSSGETSWASMACALFRRDVIDEVGDLDAKSFFLYCDDVDYSWRLRLAGYKAIFHPQAKVFHDKRLTVADGVQIGPSEEYFAAESALVLAHKWSRPDLVTRFETALAMGAPGQRKAVDAFREKQLRGELPDPIDPEHRIGQFFGDGYWAKPRW
jgi:hypothetical protein